MILIKLEFENQKLKALCYSGNFNEFHMNESERSMEIEFTPAYHLDHEKILKSFSNGSEIDFNETSKIVSIYNDLDGDSIDIEYSEINIIHALNEEIISEKIKFLTDVIKIEYDLSANQRRTINSVISIVTHEIDVSSRKLDHFDRLHQAFKHESEQEKLKILNRILTMLNEKR